MLTKRQEDALARYDVADVTPHVPEGDPLLDQAGEGHFHNRLIDRFSQDEELAPE